MRSTVNFKYIFKLSLIILLSCSEYQEEFIEISFKNGDQLISEIEKENPTTLQLADLQNRYHFDYSQIQNYLGGTENSS